MPPQRSQTSLQACKLSATLLLCLLFLPSLLFSVFFSFFAFFLFLPIVCILSSIFVLSTAIISRIPVMPLGRLVAKVCSLDDDWMVGEAPEFIEFDRSEVPALFESSEEEEEEQIKEVFVNDGQESFEELRKIQADQTPSESGECSSFHEILSFWRSKEREEKYDNC